MRKKRVCPFYQWLNHQYIDTCKPLLLYVADEDGMALFTFLCTSLTHTSYEPTLQLSLRRGLLLLHHKEYQLLYLPLRYWQLSCSRQRVMEGIEQMPALSGMIAVISGAEQKEALEAFTKIQPVLYIIGSDVIVPAWFYEGVWGKRICADPSMPIDQQRIYKAIEHLF